MKRFERRPSPILQLAIFAASAAVFWADLEMPLGVSVWILYLVPLALTLFARRPALPLVVGGVATALVIAGFFLSHRPDTWPISNSVLNRSLGMATIWLLALVARQFVAANLELRERDWVRAGAQGLGKVIRGEKAVAQIGENALRFLAEYAGAQAGAFYAAEGGRYRMVATHALDPEAAPQPPLAPGQGLVGQAAKDARLVIVSAPPGEALPLRSSFGKMVPRGLAILPASADGDVTGVVELAYTTLTGRPDVDLLGEVGEPLGVAIRSARYRAEMQELLARDPAAGGGAGAAAGGAPRRQRGAGGAGAGAARIAVPPRGAAGRAGADQRRAWRSRPRRWSASTTRWPGRATRSRPRPTSWRGPASTSPSSWPT